MATRPDPVSLARIEQALRDGTATVTGGATLPLKGGGSVTEAEFTRQVIAAAQAAGWLVAHFAPARVLRRGVEKYETPVRGDGRGFPDLCLARGGVVRLVELKADAGRLSEAQRRWVRESGAAVWRPADWQVIEATIRGE